MTKLFGFSSLFFTFLRKLLFLWVRTEVVGGSAKELELDPTKPVVYVLQHSALSSRLVLEQECIRANLPSSQQPLQIGTEHIRRSFFFLYGRRGQMFRRRQSPILTARLKQLTRGVYTNPELDVQIVPVTLFWGRAPDKEKSLLKLLLSDPWAVAGRLQKLLIILVHGRNTYVQFNKPISLRQVAEGIETEELATRKMARILRVHFRRVRQAVIGPDLSHRRTLVQSLIISPVVKDAIRETAKRDNITPAKARERARKYADEIVSNVSISGIRFLDILLTRIWNRIYNGVRINNIEIPQEAAKENAIVYVPCHRSHIDYLLLSYVLFHNGLMVPHIAAGINLNLPIVGAILRRGGAFFMRRSFRGNRLYAAVFNEYMHTMLNRGYSIEYFVEGGRSRTGRTLSPKGGMISMTLRSFLRDHRKPIVFVPVYIGYEKILEAGSYLGELRGAKKEKESIFGLFKTLKNLRNSFGQVTVNFGEPIKLAEFLDQDQPQWREQAYDTEYRPSWLSGTVERLAEKIAIHINDAAALNPVNLMGTLLLATPRQAMDERILEQQLSMLVKLLQTSPYSQYMSYPEGTPSEWIAYVERMNIVYRQKHSLGDIIGAEGPNAILLTYYRNNIQHLIAIPALIASLFRNNNTIPREHAVYLVGSIYPYVRAELFMHWSKEEIDGIVDHWIDVMCQNNLLLHESGLLYRPAIGSNEFVMLDTLSRMMLQTLERYYIAMSILRRVGPGKLNAAALEEKSSLLAQRMSMMYGLNAPEFFDKTLFRNFIKHLQINEILQQDENGYLAHREDMEGIVDDARLVLDPDMRQSILQVTHNLARQLEGPEV